MVLAKFSTYQHLYLPLNSENEEYAEKYRGVENYASGEIVVTMNPTETLGDVEILKFTLPLIK
jgi:hypothetical protein